MLRAALQRMGREDLIGPRKDQLVPRWQPVGTGNVPEGQRRKRGVAPRPGTALTQHTGLPPRSNGAEGANRGKPSGARRRRPSA